jgi:RecB family exonuclease
MKPFLKSVAEFLYATYGNRLYSMAIVFPNKRARLFFTQYISEAANKPVFSPAYFTITEYFQEIADETIADQLTLLFNLYESYISVTHSKESFDDFLFYCEMMLSDFDDIDKYQVDAGMLYKNLSNLKDIESFTDYLDESQLKAIRQFWEAFNSGRDSTEKQKFSSIWQVLFSIYSDFKQRLAQNDFAYEGMAYRNAILSIEKKEIDLPGSIVAFVGFNALNKCEDKLFGILKNRNKALFFWDYDDYYLKRKSFHEAAYFLGNLIMKYPSPPGFSFESDLSDPEKKIKIIDIPTSIGQAKSLPDVIAGLPEKWKENPIKTAIALADESLLIPVLSSLPTDIGEINISMGYPLKVTQIYSLISILIDLHQNKKIKEDKRELFYHNDVKRLLQHGMFSWINTDIANKFIGEIIKSNQIYIDFEKFQKDTIPLPFVFITGITATNFVPYLHKVLDEILVLIENNKIKLIDIETEAIAKVIAQLRRMGDILGESETIYSFKSLLRLIEKLLQSTTLPFTGEPLSGLQVMGILETRVLDFENLIILSMNEGVFPKSGNVPTFVPHTLRKAFGMPTIEHQDAIFAYYFYRLLQRSKNIVLVYSSSTSDNKTGEASRFIRQLEFDDVFKKERQTLIYSVYPQQVRKLTAEKNEASRKFLLNRYSGEAPKALSPSAINTYLNCQLRFYFRYIACIPEPESILEEVESNVLGSILHKTLEQLYKPFENKKAEKNQIDNLLQEKENFEHAIKKAFFEEYFEPGKEFTGKETVEFSGKNIIVKEVVSQYAKQIIRFDIKHSPLHIIGLEKKHLHYFNLNDGSKILIGGIIDRIEQYDGLIRIIDYKTGKVKNTFKSVEDLFIAEPEKRNEAAFQTLLYSLVVSKTTGNSKIQPCLYFVREMSSNAYESELYSGDKKDIKLESAGPLLKEFEELLCNTLESIFEKHGEFNQTLNEKICVYCPYKEICGN